MNIFFHGTIEAGFNAIKGKLEKDMAGPMGQWITEYRIADLGNNEVMCAMNCTDMEALGAFMSDPAEMQWDKDNGAVYKAYIMSEMTEQISIQHPYQVILALAKEIIMKYAVYTKCDGQIAFQIQAS